MIIPVIPKGEFEARLVSTVYRNGCIVNNYRVLVPDRTISGDFRYEYVVTYHPACLPPYLYSNEEGR